MTQRLEGATSLSREERYEEYVGMGLSLHDMARREGIDYASLLKWLGRNDGDE